MDRKVLLASFIFPERLDWFLNNLNSTFKISKESVFIFKNLDDDTKLIVTYKLTLKEDEKINFKKVFPNAILIHKKGNAIYTINALNKVIDMKYPENVGNLNYKTVKIDWDEYQNKLLLFNNNTLHISKIERIFI